MDLKSFTIDALLKVRTDLQNELDNSCYCGEGVDVELCSKLDAIEHELKIRGNSASG